MKHQDTALIIVDPQYDFCEGGSLPISSSNLIFPQINKLRKSISFNKVFITKDMHPKGHVSFASVHNKLPYTDTLIDGKKQQLWPDHCVAQTHGSDVHQLLQQDGTEIIVQKGTLKEQDSYSGFGTLKNPSILKKQLQQNNIKKVVVVGLAYDFCVGSTALDAKRFGFEVQIVNECTKSATKETQEVMKKKLSQNGVKQIGMSEILVD